MSQADELLSTLSVDYTNEPYITINDDRTITVPDELIHIAVENDHNIETVTFDCPMYWDEHNLAAMRIFINYMRPDGYTDSYPVHLIYPNEEDDTRFRFDWTISGNVTKVQGKLSFLVYIESEDANPCWHSRLNQQMIIDEGLCAIEHVVQAPDSIEGILMQVTSEYTAKAIAEIDRKTQQSLESIPEDYTTANNLAEESVRTKADAIVRSVEGNTINVSDASDDYIRGLKIFGKTTQTTTTGAQLIPYPYTDYNGNVYEDTYSAVQNGLTISIRPDHSISIYGELETAFTWVFCSKLVLPAGSYCVTPNPSSDVTLVVYNIDNETPYYGSFTITEEAAVRIYFLFQNAGTYIYEGVYPMLNAGDKLLEYERYTGAIPSPSPEYPQSFEYIRTSSSPIPALANVVGKNLFSGVFSNVAFGSSQNTSYRLSIFADSNYRSIVVPVDSSKTYSFSCGKNIWGRLYIAFTEEYPGQDTRIKFTDDTTGKELLGDYDYGTVTKVENITVPTGCNFMVVYLTNNVTTYDVTSTWYQIEVGPTATEYEAPVESACLTETMVLRGLPTTSGGNYTDSTGQQWICDEVDFERGVYIHRLGMRSLNDSNDWAFNQYSFDTLGLYLFGTYFSDIDQNEYNSPICCDQLSFQRWGNQTAGNGNKIYSTPGYVQVYLADQTITTVDAFKQWIAQHPMTVLYKLEQPVEMPLSASTISQYKKATTLRPITNVVNYLGAGMRLTYNVDLQTYINNRSVSEEQIASAVSKYLIDNPVSGETLVDTETGKSYQLSVINGKLTLVSLEV